MRRIVFVAIWEFEVKPECEARFRQAYGPKGQWVRLFVTDANYQQTLLVIDQSREYVYLTLDYWHSHEAYESFKQSHQEAYQSIDLACEDLTVAERYVGAFAQV
jgi:hypothetical protein